MDADYIARLTPAQRKIHQDLDTLIWRSDVRDFLDTRKPEIERYETLIGRLEEMISVGLVELARRTAAIVVADGTVLERNDRQVSPVWRDVCRRWKAIVAALVLVRPPDTRAAKKRIREHQRRSAQPVRFDIHGVRI